MLYKHKNKKKCIICKDALVETREITRPDGKKEKIRVQTRIQFSVFIPPKGSLDYYLKLPQDAEIPYLTNSDVPVLKKETSKDFPNGIPTGLVYAGPEDE